MSRKGILTLALLLPLLALTGGAYAAHNYQHRPDQAPMAWAGGPDYGPATVEGRSVFVPRAPGVTTSQQQYRRRGVRKSATGQLR
ncbi:MAG: hypothetical protein L0Y57_01975 [Beijerinckiaceae bacterium]|nr:hypothetical protein [Beijerinckiaceae bacterium]